MTAGICFEGPGMSSPTLGPAGVAVPPVGKPWERTVAPWCVRLDVARCHIEGRLAAALEGKTRTVGSGTVSSAPPLGGEWSPLEGVLRLMPPWQRTLLPEEQCWSPPALGIVSAPNLG